MLDQYFFIFWSVFKTECKSLCGMLNLCLSQTAGLNEKQRREIMRERERDFLIVSLKTGVYIKGEKSSCENKFC